MVVVGVVQSYVRNLIVLEKVGKRYVYTLTKHEYCFRRKKDVNKVTWHDGVIEHITPRYIWIDGHKLKRSAVMWKYKKLKPLWKQKVGIWSKFKPRPDGGEGAFVYVVLHIRAKDKVGAKAKGIKLVRKYIRAAELKAGSTKKVVVKGYGRYC